MMRNATCLTLLLLACALAAAEDTEAGPPAITGRISLDISPAYGFSSLHSLGGLVGLSYGLPLWADPATSAQVDLGILASYQFEPFSQGDAMMSGAVTTGGANRLEALARLGLTLNVSPVQGLLVSIGVVGGWAHVVMRGTLANARFGISSDYAADKGGLTAGGLVDLGIRLDDHLAILGRVLGFIPFTDAAVSAYLLASLGLSIRF